MRLPFWLYWILGGAAFSATAYGIFAVVDTDMDAGLAAFLAFAIWLGGTAAYLVLGTLAIEILRFLTDPAEGFDKLVSVVTPIFLGVVGLSLLAVALTIFEEVRPAISDYIERNFLAEWDCVESGDTMYSLSDKGELGPPEKACTCTGMADFERRKFGRVDYASLNKDHGCNFE
jgi:hypothetical protein